MSDLFYEPDLELAEAFHNLFFEIILPALIIVGHFLTITKNRAIVVNNYKYRFLEEPKKKDKTQERWLCMYMNGRNKCSASLTIDSITGEIKKVNGEKWDKVTPLRDFHDHDPEDENEVKKLFILRDINNKASSNSGPIPQMFEAKNSELADEGYTVDEIAKIMPQYNSVKSSVYRRHAENFPAIPQSLNELYFYDDDKKLKYTLTKKYNEQFLLFDGWHEITDKNGKVTGKERITIYCSETGLRLLAQAFKIGGDGTFKTRPKIYVD